MNTDIKRTLMISGMGSTHGGNFHAVKLEGLGRIESDITCTYFIVNGRAEVNGNVTAASADIKGTATIQGQMKARRAQIHGRVKIEGSYSGEQLEINGAITITGACEVEKLNANGRLHIGTLNADAVIITLHGHCEIGEIGGERIQIRRQPGLNLSRWLKILPVAIGNYLNAHTIEGDHIYLEYTTADIVRGADVTIGPGCEIGLIEYTGKLQQDKGSKIKHSEKL
ncbi:polymer-forming cytoskeletal protein [Paenibacillus roseipurpureus]|uniref:Polymer-forming cytoskeletal protein n=1 Tax=Paenibacillus roseopurpureus TaxID=2918901 RepID=A0AA96RLU1_9BACL|nr:polymer-forming cytoskeletal protein [Paenibacillus sp. MBLB1832]WNR43537.1 polymer-forming cytoskeletal protein [Paenibacillus sp. MBLB1832]